MKPFTRLTAPAAVLDRPDVDTDQIMPKQFLKRIERTGFGEFLFFDWAKDPDFELNRPECSGAGILLAGPQLRLRLVARARALGPAGGRVRRRHRPLVRGHLPAELRQNRPRPDRAPGGAGEAAVRSSTGEELTVDLERQTIEDPSGELTPFPFDAFERHRLLNGLDDIGLTLEHEAAIDEYEQRRGLARA